MSNLDGATSEDPKTAVKNDMNLIQYPSCENRRLKAALMGAFIWGGTITLHLVSWGFWIALSLTLILALHTFRLLFTQVKRYPNPLEKGESSEHYPYVSLVVSAKNEEAVVQSLVQTIFALDYPQDRFELWVVDDNSEDQTLRILESLSQDFENLNILQRTKNSSGGKSGALNEVLPLTKGTILGVFDADAIIHPNLLRHVVPLFGGDCIGAVQVRKSITNVGDNFLTRSQQSEMILDAFMQQQRVATGGVGELRGNGQFVLRQALDSCGGWNESTITDDLDLTFRLHLAGWNIDVLSTPAVNEEGVTRALALWHQRNRWAEGGYQRYLDYWPLLVTNKLGFAKSFDMLMFYVTQYALPTAAVPDMIMAIARNRLPLLMPMTSLAVALSFLGTWAGLQQVRKQENHPPKAFELVWQSMLGTLYMIHWFPVVASVTARISIRPKRLKWVKTQRIGSEQVFNS